MATRRVLVPFIIALRKRFGAPVILGGDFNATKIQGQCDEETLMDMRPDKDKAEHGKEGIYTSLCGFYGDREEELGTNQSEDTEERDEEEELARLSPMIDTWIEAKVASKNVETGNTSNLNSTVGPYCRANGCFGTTCHWYAGVDNPSRQWMTGYTQGRGTNVSDVGYGVQQTSKFIRKPVVGNQRFIDWLLVDRLSISGSRFIRGEKIPKVRVLGAEVHTERGTTNKCVDRPGPNGGPGGFSRNSSGYGSDHFPISALLEIVITRKLPKLQIASNKGHRTCETPIANDLRTMPCTNRCCKCSETLVQGGKFCRGCGTKTGAPGGAGGSGAAGGRGRAA